MHLDKPGAGKLESSRTLKECGVVSDNVLDIVCGTQKGGFRHNSVSKKNNKRYKKRTKKSKQQRNKSTKKRT
jgi:hypothetical protein